MFVAFVACTVMVFNIFNSFISKSSRCIPLRMDTFVFFIVEEGRCLFLRVC